MKRREDRLIRSYTDMLREALDRALKPYVRTHTPVDPNLLIRVINKVYSKFRLQEN